MPEQTEQNLDGAHTGWQLARIQAGIKDAEAGRVTPAEKVFEGIAKAHGLLKRF